MPLPTHGLGLMASSDETPLACRKVCEGATRGNVALAVESARAGVLAVLLHPLLWCCRG